MKVCDFIQNHKNPEQIYRLVQTIKKLSPNTQVPIGRDFTGTNRGHARILTSQDYETITNGSFHFARKFKQDTNILDML